MDLHCHGGYGVDLMGFPTFRDLDLVCSRLGRDGVGGWVPTTLSTSMDQLLKTVAHLGQWIHAHRKSRYGSLPPHASLPLGLHIEGPFLNPRAAGAHSPGTLQPAKLPLLEALWEQSRETIPILTLAPEIHPKSLLVKIGVWARKRKIRLSIGHTCATKSECRFAFEQAGFSQVTHAFNAMGFHHRETGPLGAAIARPDIFIEVIPDGIHIDPDLAHWLSRLHPDGICLVSDSTPASGTPPGTSHSFGPLKVTIQENASRVVGSQILAGGGLNLAKTYRNWIAGLSTHSTAAQKRELIRATENGVHQNPLRALGLTTRIIKGKNKISL